VEVDLTVTVIDGKKQGVIDVWCFMCVHNNIYLYFYRNPGWRTFCLSVTSLTPPQITRVQSTTTDHSTIREPHMVPNVSMPSASLFLGNVFQTPHTTDTVNITSTTSIVFESRHGLTIGFGRQGDQHVCGGTQR
jgi:hypothetical protein